jgi:hypothetical protein
LIRQDGPFEFSKNEKALADGQGLVVVSIDERYKKITAGLDSLKGTGK